MAERLNNMAEPGGGETLQHPGQTGGNVPPENITSSEEIHSLEPQIPPEGTTSSEVIHSLPRTEGHEGPRGPEWETSPEIGRAIVKEIIRLETTLPYEVRYNEQNGPYLDQLYKTLQNYTRALRRVRNQRDSWNPIATYREIRRALGGETVSETTEPARTATRRGERPAPLPDEAVSSLLNLYKEPQADTDLDDVENNLATYFQEARALGLLDRADDIFLATYRQIILSGDVPADQAQELLIKNTTLARSAIEGAFRAHSTDPRLDRAKLQGIGEAYSQRTEDLFNLLLTGDRLNLKEGEFRFSEYEEDEEDTEKYWRPGHYPKLYEIIAKTKRQFSRAKDTFLSMITGGGLGKSPDELYEHFNNFTEKFSQTASAQGVDDEYIMDSRLELGGRGYVFGADYSFETYNPKSANQFLMAMALHEGPQRWVSVARSGNGGVAAHLWKFDSDPRIALMHNPGGSRGQLLSDTVTQHYLHTEIRNILIEEGMGVVLKNYDPRDEDSIAFANHSIKVSSLPEAERKREEYLNANLARIGIHQPNEEFKNLYEGFDKGDSHLINYQKYQALDEKELKKLPLNLRRAVAIGKVQIMIKGHEGKNRKQLLGVIDGLRAEGRLTDKEKRMWAEAYDQSKANFDTAFQMVGAMGEKARRGGGVFFIDRKDEKGRKFVDNMPVYLAEKYVQCVENYYKIMYSNASATDRTAAVAEARRLAIEQIKQNGFEAKIVMPKLKFDTDSGEVIGVEEGETETLDFNIATKSIFSRWTNHTYWGYQQENRHMLTDPEVVAAAKRIRAGLSKPEDEDNLATLLLIVDPTLKRVGRIEDTQVREGESAMQQEIVLFEAAVEASNQGHWRIARELNAAFMPEDGNTFKMRTGYNLEDYAGIARFIIRMRQYIAAHPKRFARRYANELANLPMNVSSMPDQWGQEGVLGAIEMFADPVGALAEQREASQFAITKWVDQMRMGNMLFGALVGQVDQERGFSIEGLFEKPTNNSDKLVALWDKLPYITQQPNLENEFFYAVMESLDRLWIVLKLVRTMESDVRNAQGVLDLEKVEVFIDGKVNPAIATERNTGSSRHTERIFFDKYIDWLLSNKPGGGMATYPSEVEFYKFLKEPYFYYKIAEGGEKIRNDKGDEIEAKKGDKIRWEDGRTWADWLFDKMAR